jgi:hypothetical protein
MSTKLEAMVGLLAGRKVEPALLEELADPTSEASLFLEATRARSRALLAEPEMVASPKGSRSRRTWIIPFVILAVVALLLFAAALWVVDRRFRLLEASLGARDLEARADSRRVEAILERLSDPRPALERIKEDIASLERSLRTVPPAPVDPALAQLRDELATLRHELSAAEKAASKKSEQLQAEIHDAGRLIKLLIPRLDPLAPDLEPPSGFKPTRPPAPVDPRRVKP